MILPYNPLVRSNSLGSCFDFKMENSQSFLGETPEHFGSALGTSSNRRVVNGSKRQKVEPADLDLHRQSSDATYPTLSLEKSRDSPSPLTNTQGFMFDKRDSISPNESDINFGASTGIKPIMHNQYSLGSEFDKTSKHTNSNLSTFRQNNEENLLFNSVEHSLSSFPNFEISQIPPKIENATYEAEVSRPNKPTKGKQLDLKSLQISSLLSNPTLSNTNANTNTSINTQMVSTETKAAVMRQHVSTKKRRPSRHSHHSHFSSDYVYSLPLASPQTLASISEINQYQQQYQYQKGKREDEDEDEINKGEKVDRESMSVVSETSDYLSSKRLNRLNPVKNTASKQKKLGYTSSEYNGVCFNKRKDKWRARFNYNGKREFLGDFDTEKEAALAFDKRIREVYPKGKQEERLNFVDGGVRNPLTMKQ